jgi:dihydroorotate dehydrogenase electron transfer subunit
VNDTSLPCMQMPARILELRELAPAYFLLSLYAPEITRTALPGQFVQIRVAPPHAIDPLLARPISIYRADPATGTLSVIFKVVGRGTRMLTTYGPGDVLTVLGPVGRGFAIPEAARSLALVAGGVGMPPLFFLAETLRRTRPALACTLFYGGRTAGDLLELPAWAALGVTVVPATDDGSLGHHGLVTEPLQTHLNILDFVVACGPRPMLRAVQHLALQAGVPGQLSLEARMACGVGACLGCVCATLTGNRRVCVDGPVFPLEEVRFDA